MLLKLLGTLFQDIPMWLPSVPHRTNTEPLLRPKKYIRKRPHGTTANVFRIYMVVGQESDAKTFFLNSRSMMSETAPSLVTLQAVPKESMAM